MCVCMRVVCVCVPRSPCVGVFVVLFVCAHARARVTLGVRALMKEGNPAQKQGAEGLAMCGWACVHAGCCRGHVSEEKRTRPPTRASSVKACK